MDSESLAKRVETVHATLTHLPVTELVT